jgi:outer membrane protein TolC
LRQTRLQQQAELHGALARLQAAETALDAAHKRVAAADEAARIEGVRYDYGAATIEDLLRARTRAAAAEAFLAKTKGDVLGTAARINALVEREIVR